MLPPYTRIYNENIVIMITKKETYFKRFPISKCGRWDLNPHVRNEHKILSLARLPVPTLPHIFDFLSLVSRDFDIISNQTNYVNT